MDKITAQSTARHLRDIAESMDKVSGQASHPWFMMAIAIEELIRDKDKLKGEKDELTQVMYYVQEEFHRWGERFPEGFDSRLFRWIDDAIGHSYREEDTTVNKRKPRSIEDKLVSELTNDEIMGLVMQRALGLFDTTFGQGKK